jgi:hypothetical protein
LTFINKVRIIKEKTMYLNVILTIFVIIQLVIIILTYRFWKKYGKQMFNTYMEIKKSIPNQMFSTNPAEMMKGLPDMSKMMSEFQTLTKIMKNNK